MEETKEKRQTQVKVPLIIVDTREQRPLWDPKRMEVKAMKLDEGDYTTEDLHGIAHIERKSGIDLYGSIIQGHKRFTAELTRAMDKNIELAIFVECPEEMFYRKLFPGGFRVKAPTQTLRKIVPTIAEKYNVKFFWCEDREDMKTKSIAWFNEKRKKYLGKKE